MILSFANLSCKDFIRLSLLCNSYKNSQVNLMCMLLCQFLSQSQYLAGVPKGSLTSIGDCFCGSVFLLLSKISKPHMRPGCQQVPTQFCIFLSMPIGPQNELCVCFIIVCQSFSPQNRISQANFSFMIMSNALVNEYALFRSQH